MSLDVLRMMAINCWLMAWMAPNRSLRLILETASQTGSESAEYMPLFVAPQPVETVSRLGRRL